jgi:hypothetical protein
MYSTLLILHSIGRWILLILLVAVIIRALGGMTKDRPYNAGDKKIALLLMITAHIMLLVGLYQWFASDIWGLHSIQTRGFGEVMKDKIARFWAIEHMAGMLIGIILITIGRGVGKKNISDNAKHKKSFWMFLIAFIIIVASIPWPNREVGRPMIPGMENVP